MKQRIGVMLALCMCLLSLLALPVSAAGKVTDVRIAANPAKLSYLEGESFDPAGMVIIITYEDGTTAPAEITDYHYSPAGPLSAVHQAVVIDCAGKKLTLPITVTAVSSEQTSGQPSSDSEDPIKTTTAALTTTETPPQASDRSTPRTDRQGQDWTFLHWSAAVLVVIAAAAALVVHYFRYLAGKR